MRCGLPSRTKPRASLGKTAHVTKGPEDEPELQGQPGFLLPDSSPRVGERQPSEPESQSWWAAEKGPEVLVKAQAH